VGKFFEQVKRAWLDVAIPASQAAHMPWSKSNARLARDRLPPPRIIYRVYRS
jgi:hypothetical protein